MIKFEWRKAYDPASDRWVYIAWIGDATVGWSCDAKRTPDSETEALWLSRAEKFLQTNS